MAVMAGKDGSVSVGSQKVAYLDNFSININCAIADISQFGNDWKENLETQKDWSASCSGTFDYSDPQQKALVDRLISGSEDELNMEFVVSKALTLTGKAVISNVSITAAVADKVAVSFSATGNGAISSKGV